MLDCIIIGGGPAGMNAALNLRRAGRNVLVLEGSSFGGQMALSPRLENIPGFKSISGLEYCDLLFEQISDLGATFELEKAMKIIPSHNHFIVKGEYNEYQAKTIIIANGCSHRSLGLENEEKYIGKGISYCAVCDGTFYEGQEVNIIGDANTALQYALSLSLICPKVHLYALFDRLFADQILIDRIDKNEKIDVTYHVSLQEFKGEEFLKGLIFKNTLTNETFTINTNNVFIAIGQIPHNEVFKDIIKVDDKGFIITNEFMETSYKGIYAIGDTRQKSTRQVITALGDASVASNEINRYLNSLD